MCLGAPPSSLLRSASIATARAAGFSSPSLGRPQPVRRGGAADDEGLGFVGCAASLRIEGVEGLGGGVGKVAAGGDEQRRPHRGRHQDCRRDRSLPVAFVDQRDRRGPLRDLGRGEDGERHAGRGGRRVGAADPGRVVGGKRRVAQFFGRFGGGGLLFLGRRFGRGLDRRRRGLFVLLVRAAAAEHGSDQEDERRPGPARRLPSALPGSACACASPPAGRRRRRRFRRRGLLRFSAPRRPAPVAWLAAARVPAPASAADPVSPPAPRR